MQSVDVVQYIDMKLPICCLLLIAVEAASSFDRRLALAFDRRSRSPFVLIPFLELEAL